MKTRALTFPLIIISVLAANAHAAPPITLPDAHRAALDRGPGVAAGREGVQAAEIAARAVNRSRLPMLAYELDATRGDHPVYVFGSLLAQGQFEARHFSTDFLNNPSDLTNVRNALVVAMPLFTGFEISDRHDVGLRRLDRSRAQLKAVDQQTAEAVVSAYLDALRFSENAAALERRVASASDAITVADRLMKRGMVLGSDYHAARGVLHGLQARAARESAMRQGALSRLSILTGTPVEAVAPSGPLALPSRTEEAGPALGSPAVEMASADQSIAASAARLESRSLLPRLSAFGRMETNTDDFSSNPSNHMAGLRLTAALGDPTWSSRRRAARLAVDAAALQAVAQREAVEAQVAELTAARDAIGRTLPELDKARAQAMESLRLIAPLYREGRQSVLDVLRTEEMLATMETSRTEAITEYLRMQARLLAVTGGLGPDAVDRIAGQIRPEVKP